MRTLKRASKVALVLGWGLILGSACRSSEGSVSLRFPSLAARQAVVRMTLEVYDPDAAGLAGADGRSCEGLLGRAAEGTPLTTGVPVRAAFDCPLTDEGACPEGWFEEVPPLTIPGGPSVVYVLGFASSGPEAVPFLEGCTDRFDTGGSGDGADRVPVQLDLVLPGSTRLVLDGPNRVVGRPGTLSEIPLSVRVEAEDPELGRFTYPIPGVPVTYTGEGGIAWEGADASGRLTVYTNRFGQARAAVVFSSTADSSSPVEARSEPIAEVQDSRASVSFRVSSVAEAPLNLSQFSAAEVGVPVALALGSLRSDAQISLAVLGCRGSPEACAAGRRARAPLGASRIAVFDGLAEASPRSVPLERGLDVGVLPSDVLIAPLLNSTLPQIAVLSARRADCQERVCQGAEDCPCWTDQSGAECPCESSEIHVLERTPAGVVAIDRLALTASNAVSMAAYRSPEQEPFRIGVAAQGRSVNERPCSTAERCLPSDLASCRSQPDGCGCPALEQCECVGCPSGASVGVCVARDQVIDMLGLSPETGVLRNHLGCQDSVVRCNRRDPRGRDNICECLDAAERGGRCDRQGDGCGCLAPFRVFVGPPNAPAIPFDLAAGQFDGVDGDDLVAGTDSGLEILSGATDAFRTEQKPLTNVPVNRVAAGNLDAQFEREGGFEAVDDIAWIAQGPCQRGVSFEERCPIAVSADSARGCFGVYVSDGLSELYDISVRSPARCRRFELSWAPADLCMGDVDGNGHADVVVSNADGGSVFAFLGDGFGGLLFPPAELSLESAASGGPIACADVDGDGVIDVFAADAEGQVSVLRSRP